MKPIKLMDLDIAHPIMNAAGTAKTLEDVERFSASASAAVLVGSITIEPRSGNSGNVWYSEDIFSLNSFSLPNPGAEYYKKNLPKMATTTHKVKKPLFFSVVGFSPEEYAELTLLAFENGADAVEINLGCPNVWKDSKQKQIACFNKNLVQDILQEVQGRIKGSAPIAVKISPFSDPFALNEITSIIASNPIVKAITTTNSFPNASAYNNSGKLVIDPGEGFAGLSGPSIKSIGIGQVRQIRNILPRDKQIIGVGGINSADDVKDYLHAGASAIQLATAYFKHGYDVFEELVKSYEN